MILYDNTDKDMKPVYLTHSNFLGDISIPPNLKTPCGMGSRNLGPQLPEAKLEDFLKWSFT